MSAATSHLAAFSSLLAHDEEAGALHMRDLQIIALLVSHGTPLSVGAIATLLSISSSHVSRTTDKLVGRGLLARAVSQTDKRIALVEPTEAGRVLDDRIRAHFHASGPPC
jgi:DNA-binding MarR family transcriptional regulator